MRYSFLLSAMLMLSSCGSTITVDSIDIAPYRDGRQAAVSFTFDDGMLCHYTDIAPELEKCGLRGTFWIIGANMGTDAPDYPWMTWEQVADLARRGHEISNHTWHHPNLVQLSADSVRWEVQYCDSVLESVIGRRPRTLAYPYNAMSEEVVRICSEERVGTRTFQTGQGQIESHQTADSLTQWLDGIIAQGAWGVTMTHGTTYGWDMWKDPQVLYNFFAEVSQAQDRVWVGTFEEVAAYVAEAKDAKIANVQSGTVASFTPLLQSLPADLYDQPLSFCVKGQFDHAQYEATQGGITLEMSWGEDCLLINACPNGIPVEIRKK